VRLTLSRDALPSPTAAIYRIRQGLHAIRPAIPSDQEEILVATLTPAQGKAFRALSRHDQSHCCRVYRLLQSEGAPHDLLVAALLHDVAKAGPDRRVRLPDRVARVVLRRFTPRLLARLSRLPAPRWRGGLALAVHHPGLGSERARALGCSERACWLIAHHEDVPVPDDPDLKRLVRADHAAA
jgi:hypothetical protein